MDPQQPEKGKQDKANEQNHHKQGHNQTVAHHHNKHKHKHHDHQVPAPNFFPHRIDIVLKAPNEDKQIQKYLEIIAKVLQVDKELKADVLVKQIVWDQETNEIQIKFWAKELKLMRSCVTGFLRHMQLVASTIKEFAK